MYIYIDKGNNFKKVIFRRVINMIKNFLMLLSVLLFVFFVTRNNVSAMKDKLSNELSYFYEEVSFLNSIDVDKLKDKFFEEFKIFNMKKEENENLLVENIKLNREIKEKLEAKKENVSHEVWKEIRNYKSKINNMKISTREKVKNLIQEQKYFLRKYNYDDAHLVNFINVLINAKNLNRDSIVFEKNYLHKINDLI